MKSQRRFIFHIGDHKTGTTTIQRALANRKVVSPGVRILYPAAMNHNYLRRHFGEYAKAQSILADHDDRPNLKRISSLLARGDYDVAILSAEEFENADPVIVADIIDRFIRPHVDEITILCYVRPHAARTLSEYAEQTKIGLFDGTLAEFHKKLHQNRRLIYQGRLLRWQRQFTNEFIIRPAVSKFLVKESAMADFVEQTIGPSERAQFDTSARNNESLSLHDLMTLKLLHRNLKPQKPFVSHAMGWLLAEQLSSRDKKEKSHQKVRLHKSLAEEILMDYREDAMGVDECFFKDNPVFHEALILAASQASEQSLSLEPEDHLNESEKRTVEALAAVMKLMLGKKGNGPWAGYLQEHRIRTFAC